MATEKTTVQEIFITPIRRTKTQFTVLNDNGVRFGADEDA